MDDAVTVTSPGELVALVPHLLGFRPAESMVCLAFGNAPVARVDLPTSESDIPAFVSALAEVYGRLSGTPMALVAFSEDPHRALQALGPLVDRLGQGRQLGPVLWVKGDEFTELNTVTRGRVDPEVAMRMGAEFVFRGAVAPKASRDDLAAELHGDPTNIEAMVPDATRRFESLELSDRVRECGWVQGRLQQFLGDRRDLDDADATRLLVALADSQAYGVVVMGLRREQAAVGRELWLDLTRRAPGSLRDRPASVLALTSWLDGKGAHAWVALDAISHPENLPLTRVLSRALENALDPAVWDRVHERRAASRPLGAMPGDRTIPGHERSRPGRESPSAGPTR